MNNENKFDVKQNNTKDSAVFNNQSLLDNYKKLNNKHIDNSK